MLRVNGGPARSGTVVKRERGGKWTCACIQGTGTRYDETDTLPAHVTLFRTQPAYWSRCPDCGARRP